MDRATIGRINRAMAILSLALGLALLLGAGIWSARHREFVKGAAAVRGEVVAYVQKVWTDAPGTPGSTGLQHQSYCAVVHYMDPAGEARSYQDDICFNPPSFQVGDTVTLRYDPRNTTHVMVDRGNKVYVVPLVVALVGVLCIVGGVQRLTGRYVPVASEIPQVPILQADPPGHSTL
jgi:hypothetical protein